MTTWQIQTRRAYADGRAFGDFGIFELFECLRFVLAEDFEHVVTRCQRAHETASALAVARRSA